MKYSSLELLVCPDCHGRLDLESESNGSIDHGSLKCTACRQDYPVERGIPQFIQPEMLSGSNRRFSHMYDWFSWGYRAFSKLAFGFIGMKEETGRREITDRLEPRGGDVLEVSIGPGVNLPYIIDRPDVGEVFGLDISLGQLLRCKSYVHKKVGMWISSSGTVKGCPFKTIRSGAYSMWAGSISSMIKNPPSTR